MANGIPTDPPVTRKQDWGAIVRERWGDAWLKHEVIYEFTKGRKFESSDYGTSGLYRSTIAYPYDLVRLEDTIDIVRLEDDISIEV